MNNLEELTVTIFCAFNALAEIFSVLGIVPNWLNQTSYYDCHVCVATIIFSYLTRQVGDDFQNNLKHFKSYFFEKFIIF